MQHSSSGTLQSCKHTQGAGRAKLRRGRQPARHHRPAPRGGKDRRVISYTKLSPRGLFQVGRRRGKGEKVCIWVPQPPAVGRKGQSVKRNTASVPLGQSAGKAEAANTRKAMEQQRATEPLRSSSPDNPRGGLLPLDNTEQSKRQGRPGKQREANATASCFKARIGKVTQPFCARRCYVSPSKDVGASFSSQVTYSPAPSPAPQNCSHISAPPSPGSSIAGAGAESQPTPCSALPASPAWSAPFCHPCGRPQIDRSNRSSPPGSSGTFLATACSRGGMHRSNPDHLRSHTRCLSPGSWGCSSLRPSRQVLQTLNPLPSGGFSVSCLAWPGCTHQTPPYRQHCSQRSAPP